MTNVSSSACLSALERASPYLIAISNAVPNRPSASLLSPRCSRNRTLSGLFLYAAVCSGFPYPPGPCASTLVWDLPQKDISTVPCMCAAPHSISWAEGTDTP